MYRVNLTERFQAIKEQQAESINLKAQVRARIEVMKPQIDEGRSELAKLGVTYNTVEELENLLAEKEERFEQILSNLEERFN